MRGGARIEEITGGVQATSIPPSDALAVSILFVPDGFLGTIDCYSCSPAPFQAAMQHSRRKQD